MERVAQHLASRCAGWISLLLLGASLLHAERASAETSAGLLPRGSSSWLPIGFTAPTAPAGNPLSAAKIELGRHLFYDTRLSFDGAIACASCHAPEFAFADREPRALARNQRHRFGAPSLLNVGYRDTLGWLDARPRALEEQMRDPLFGREPVEHGIAGHEELVLERLRGEARYPALFAAAFPETPPAAESITLARVIDAVASFERRLVSGNSPYDRWLFQDEREALPLPARTGMRLFFGAKLRCGECHGGLLLGGKGFAASNATGVPLRVPSLRNVAFTPPYMHDGRFGDLRAVIEHYAAGPAAADPRLAGFLLTPAERDALLAFLASVGDPAPLADPALRDPWAPREPE